MLAVRDTMLSIQMLLTGDESGTRYEVTNEQGRTLFLLAYEFQHICADVWADDSEERLEGLIRTLEREPLTSAAAARIRERIAYAEAASAEEGACETPATGNATSDAEVARVAPGADEESFRRDVPT